jgi:hypothetical protein
LPDTWNISCAKIQAGGLQLSNRGGMNDDSFVDAAVSAAKQAGCVHRKYFNQDLVIKKKSSAYDFLTVADVEAEKP